MEINVLFIYGSSKNHQHCLYLASSLQPLYRRHVISEAYKQRHILGRLLAYKGAATVGVVARTADCDWDGA